MFKVGVEVFLVDRLTRGLGGMVRGLGLAEQQAKAFEKSLTGIRARMVIGTALMGIGAAAAYGLYRGAKSAAEFQRTLTELQIATGMTRREMTAMRAEIEQVSHATMFGVNTVGNLAITMRGLGMARKDMMALLPMLTMAAEVVSSFPGKGSPVQVVTALGSIAKMAGLHTAAAMHPVMETAAKLMELTPGGASGLQTQGRYVIPTSTALGIPIQKMLPFMATLLEVGGGGGGRAGGVASGAGLAMFLQRLVPGAAGGGVLPPHRQIAALFELGLLDRNRQSTILTHGVPDLTKVIRTLSSALTRLGRFEFEKVAKVGFGTTGGRVAEEVALQAFGVELAATLRRIGAMAPVEKQQKTLQSIVWNATLRAMTDLKNLVINAFLPGMKELLPVINQIDAAINRASTWMLKHPHFALQFDRMAVSLTAIAGATGAVVVLGGVAKMLGLIAASQGAGTAATIAGGGGAAAGGALALTPFGLVAAGLAAGAAGAIYGGPWLGRKLIKHFYPHDGLPPTSVIRPSGGLPPSHIRPMAYHIGEIRFGDIHIHGAGSPEATADRVIARLTSELHTALYSTGTADGLYEAALFHNAGPAAVGMV